MENCNAEIFKHGESILCAGAEIDFRSKDIEAWVKKIASKSGQKVDWHFSGGWVNVLYIGDYDLVLAAVNEFKDEFKGCMRIFSKGETNGTPYRSCQELPEGVIGGFYE